MGICNKSWWIYRCWYTMDWFACKKYWNYLFWQFWQVEYVTKEIKKLLDIKTNISRIQANNSIICRCFCIGFIDFMLAGKTLIDYTTFVFTLWFSKKCQSNFYLF